MHLYNADGAEAMMWGTASRCIGKYLYEKKITSKTPIRLETLSGIKILDLHVEDGTVKSVTVDMLEPIFCNKKQLDTEDGSMKEGTLEADERIFTGTYVSMGNPHFVIFGEELDTEDIKRYGKSLEYNKIFPERCNIEFANVREDGSIRMRVWERSSGISYETGRKRKQNSDGRRHIEHQMGREQQSYLHDGTRYVCVRRRDRLITTIKQKRIWH